MGMKRPRTDAPHGAKNEPSGAKIEPSGAKIEPCGISLFRKSVVTISLYAGFAIKKINRVVRKLHFLNNSTIVQKEIGL